MPIATVNFKKVIQNTQTIGSEESRTDHMVSHVFFDLEVEGDRTPDLFVEVSQPHGTDYASAPLEVGPPQSASGPYTGNWNANEFSDHVDGYYRALIGTSGGLIKVGGGNIVMQNNTLIASKTVTLTIP